MSEPSYWVACVECGEEEMLDPTAIRSWVDEHNREHDPESFLPAAEVRSTDTTGAESEVRDEPERRGTTHKEDAQSDRRSPTGPVRGAVVVGVLGHDTTLPTTGNAEQ